jgi:hypothetical protein
MKTRTSVSTSEIAWGATTLPTTHIISENLDIPDYKHAVARGIYIVTVRIAMCSTQLACCGELNYLATKMLTLSNIASCFYHLA